MFAASITCFGVHMGTCPLKILSTVNISVGCGWLIVITYWDTGIKLSQGSIGKVLLNCDMSKCLQGKSLNACECVTGNVIQRIVNSNELLS